MVALNAHVSQSFGEEQNPDVQAQEKHGARDCTNDDFSTCMLIMLATPNSAIQVFSLPEGDMEALRLEVQKLKLQRTMPAPHRNHLSTPLSPGWFDMPRDQSTMASMQQEIEAMNVCVVSFLTHSDLFNLMSLRSTQLCASHFLISWVFRW